MDAVLARLLQSTAPAAGGRARDMALVELLLGIHGDEVGAQKLNEAGMFKQLKCASPPRRAGRSGAR